ncbi:GDP-mannose 4,6-dehydratase [Vicingaceae bacterium]|nr:GDP-mannose 4,6-dehydratase [Vicingaceae bacterium]MDB4060483.1 GDP-mannose 4,6-dehydratase [Vicingaceae bacterium]
MQAIITGISGQDGAYLAKKLIDKGVWVTGVVRNELSSLVGLDYLGIKNEVDILQLNGGNADDINSLLKEKQPDYIFNLAAQSSVADSFKNPHSTILFNIHSTLNILEAIRSYSPHTCLYQATSSEMFGSVGKLPICENTLLYPQSPYAISKSSCHYLVRNYRESYNLHVSSGILFNHESVLRKENFFIMKIIKAALDIKSGRQEILEVGNIDIKRDFGSAPHYVNAMIKMVEMEQPDDYIICSGKSVSLRSIIHHLFNYLELDLDRIKINKKFYRPSEINDIYGDNSKAKTKLDWDYQLEFTDVLEKILVEYQNNFYHV